MKQLFVAFRVFVVLTVVSGFLYTFAVTAFARIIFPDAAGGSLVWANGQLQGSRLVAQEFSMLRYFHARPSAVSYNPLPSGASNRSVISSDLKKEKDKRALAFPKDNGLSNETMVPYDMLFTSASGLDPDISPQAALLQINRIAAQRHFSGKAKETLVSIVKQSTGKPQLGFLGESRVNVLALNLALDSLVDKP